MRYCIRFAFAFLTLAILATAAQAASSYSWEGGLEGWEQDPDGFGGTAVASNTAPAGAITDGSYALELNRSSLSWTSIVKSVEMHPDLLANTTLEFDAYLAPGQFGEGINAWGNIKVDINWQGPHFGNDFIDEDKFRFNATDNVYHFSWDYADHPTFMSNPGAEWAVVTFILQGSDLDQVYIDNLQLSNSLHNADFDADEDVDATDLATWQAAYGSGAGGDANVDTDTDGADFLIWQQQYTGALGVSVGTSVPEPSTAVSLLLALAGLAAVSRRA